LRERGIEARQGGCRFAPAAQRNRFHEHDHLTLNGLALDAAVSAQQPQTESAVEEQQAFDFAALAVAIVEERDRHIERGRYLLKTCSAHTIDALLILLDLLETDA
jgi:hypothetical protein